MHRDVWEAKLSQSSGVQRRVIRHFRVVLEEAKEPTGYSTAAIRGCMCCGTMICGMGGGGDYLCQDCLKKMQTGEMAEALYLLARSREGDGV